MGFINGFIIGAVVGLILGFFISALLMANKKFENDDEAQIEFLRKYNNKDKNEF